MRVEVVKAAIPSTPASEMSKYISEHLASIMIANGISSLSINKHSVGYGVRINVDAVNMNAPTPIIEQCNMIKDHLAGIMAVSNILKITIHPSDKDLQSISNTWIRKSPA